MGQGFEIMCNVDLQGDFARHVQKIFDLSVVVSGGSSRKWFEVFPIAREREFFWSLIPKNRADVLDICARLCVQVHILRCSVGLVTGVFF